MCTCRVECGCADGVRTCRRTSGTDEDGRNYADGSRGPERVEFEDEPGGPVKSEADGEGCSCPNPDGVP